MKRSRVGHNMRRVCVYVSEHPGCNVIAVARALAPISTFFMSTSSGAYATVHACLRQGFIRDINPDGREYELEVTPAGMALAIADGALP